LKPKMNVSVSGKIGKVSPRSRLEQTFKRLGLERKGLVCIPRGKYNKISKINDISVVTDTI